MTLHMSKCKIFDIHKLQNWFWSSPWSQEHHRHKQINGDIKKKTHQKSQDSIHHMKKKEEEEAEERLEQIKTNFHGHQEAQLHVQSEHEAN